MRHILLLLLLMIPGPGSAGEPLRIAVAANFRATLQQASDLFQQQTGFEVVLSSGSTGVLYNQILHGAPFDLFFAADRESAEQLAGAAGADGRGKAFCYARGRLVLAGGSGGLAQLGNPERSLAIANPATAPYGVAAMAVLARPEFAAGTSRKLVRGANVVQAYQFWRSGAVDLALLPRALAPGATLVPAGWHQPLEQFAVALTPATANQALASYLNWIRSDTVRTLILDAGYEPCP
ncbi:MAG: molybdate ABC transporter substrate-binding protein [Gammaproteobacteria bacterium]|jgi:molybdate transport system substrate-binding protein|nr:molybdate ABC transporter substrate-binding protein [Gammaproteobacteria bacterium]MDH5172931.1 molybdate ABC transporter substrate-binding protein [Gammaproteobacteria bacterium]